MFERLNISKHHLDNRLIDHVKRHYSLNGYCTSLVSCSTDFESMSVLAWLIATIAKPIVRCYFSHDPCFSNINIIWRSNTFEFSRPGCFYFSNTSLRMYICGIIYDASLNIGSSLVVYGKRTYDWILQYSIRFLHYQL